jgi:hypothetical protein
MEEPLYGITGFLLFPKTKVLPSLEQKLWDSCSPGPGFQCGALLGILAFKLNRVPRSWREKLREENF